MHLATLQEEPDHPYRKRAPTKKPYREMWMDGEACGNFADGARPSWSQAGASPQFRLLFLST